MRSNPRHACPGRCGSSVPLYLLACRVCWTRLPAPLRDAVSAAYRNRVAAPHVHRAAVLSAVNWYRLEARPTP